MSSTTPYTRDIVVIGSSLGGVDALSELLQQLPQAFPASVLIVQHVADQSQGHLAGILNDRTTLGVQTAVDGMELMRGCAYVAPPGRHLILTRDGVRVVYGPRENRARPAIDPLFRTAAVNYQSRVIGVVLTGLLNDGAAGLLAVARCGGLPLVQALDDAAYADMPRNALAAVPDARQVRLSELGAVLHSAVREEAPAPPAVPDTIRIEVELTERAMTNDDWQQVPSRSTDFTCPECNGALRRIDEEGVKRYRCRIGHAYTADSLVAAKDEAAEAALWVALQTLDERVQMLRSMADNDSERGWASSAASLQDRVREAESHARNLRRFIQRISP